jgi:hypothetical protein
MLDEFLGAIARYFEACSKDFAAEGQEPASGYNAPGPDSSFEIPPLPHRGAARHAG